NFNLTKHIEPFYASNSCINISINFRRNMKKLLPLSFLLGVALLLAVPARADGPAGPNEITAVSGPAANQVTITWKQYSSETSSFNLVYGTGSGSYQYGATGIAAPGVGNFVTFIVDYLNPGQTYYFNLSG